MVTGRPLRMGLIGTSGHANRVAAPCIARSPDIQLAGAAGSTPESSREFSRRHGLDRVYESIDALLEDPSQVTATRFGVTGVAAMQRPSGENTGASRFTFSASPRMRAFRVSISTSSKVVSNSRSLPML